MALIRATVIAGKRISLRRPGERLYATEAPLVNATKPSLSSQPLFYSHPHLVKPNELTEGVPHEEYERRRKQLMDSLPDDSIVISTAASMKYMSQHIFYKFRQASDFWYLTGFQEPDSAVILEKNQSSRGYRMTIFCHPKQSDWEKWNGARNGLDKAVETFKADDALDVSRFTSYLKSALSNHAHANIYVDGIASKRKRSVLNYISSSLTPKSDYDSIVDSLSSHRRRPLSPEIFKLRLVKSEVEQRLMRLSADISCQAHTNTMKFCQPGRSEAELAAHFEYSCAMQGAQRLAYVPVVASGANALTIHYTANNHRVHPGELVLIDAGCEFNGYASDITRTWPVSGKFTEPQRVLYQAILNAQKSCIALCSEASGLNMMDLHRRSCRFLTQELRKIGFSLHTGDLERILYPHFLSHAIGIDLHETQSNRTDDLKDGMVITIEPGIYVPPEPQFPKEFHNLGIRVEDEILVRKDHAVVLSINAPKEIEDVEAACQNLLTLGTYDSHFIEERRA